MAFKPNINNYCRQESNLLNIQKNQIKNSNLTPKKYQLNGDSGRINPSELWKPIAFTIAVIHSVACTVRINHFTGFYFIPVFSRKLCWSGPMGI